MNTVLVLYNERPPMRVYHLAASLDPWATPPRWRIEQGYKSAIRYAAPSMWSWAGGPPREVVTLDERRYFSEALRTEITIHALDQTQVLNLLRSVEGVILAFRWLARSEYARLRIERKLGRQQTKRPASADTLRARPNPIGGSTCGF